MSNAHPIDEVVAGDLCVGCGLCAGMFSVQAAHMVMAPSGQLRPEVRRPLTAPEAALFLAVCPGRQLVHPDNAPVSQVPVHLLWGPLIEVRTGHAVDPQTRYNGSSGGVISALAIHLLESGQVAGVVHIAASETDPFANEPQISRTRADVLKAAGSRYAPASPLKVLQRCLAEPGVFAFIGKPCDVAGLRALAREVPAVADKFPFMLSFMCAGTPSMAGTNAVIAKLGMQPQDVVRFRYRGDGWPGNAKAESTDGRMAVMDYATSWGTILNRHLQLRCKLCPDGTGEFADITCADAWFGDDKGFPTFVEAEGRSLIAVRSARGMQLHDEALAAGAIASDNLPASDIEKMQPYQADRKRVLIARLAGRLLAGRPVPRFRRLRLLRAALGTSPIRLIRNGIGTWMRSIDSRG